MLVLFASQMAILADLKMASTGNRNSDVWAADLDKVTIRAETTILVDSGDNP